MLQALSISFRISLQLHFTTITNDNVSHNALPDCQSQNQGARNYFIVLCQHCVC